MSSKERDEMALEPTEGASLDTSFRSNDDETRSRSDSIDSQRTHSKQTSVDTTIDDKDDEGTIKPESPRDSSNELSEPSPRNKGESGDEDGKKSGSGPEDEDLSAWLDEQPKKVNVKWSDYEAFKNRYSVDEGLDIIEVLEGHPEQLKMEILRERSKRRHKKHSTSRRKRHTENNAKFLYRIRLQSAPVIYVLGRVTSHGFPEYWDDPFLTFFRPFHAFYYSLPWVKQILRLLQRRSNHETSPDQDATTYTDPLEREDETSSIETDDPLQTLSMPPDVDLEDIVDGLLDLKAGSQNSLNATEHLKVYIDFVEQHVVPMWVEARGSTKHKVLFSDLSMYFRPGDILFEPLKSRDDKNNAGSAGSNAVQNEGLAVHQSYWKLCYAQFREHSPRDNNGDDTLVGKRMLKYTFNLHCFHVDFDGTRYGPAFREIEIARYDGELDIRSLNAYPLRFSVDKAQTMEELTARARNFFFYNEQRHLSYDGWTLVHETHADRLAAIEKRPGSEHIEGEVMIDFKEGFQSDSGFVKPTFNLPNDPDESSSSSMDSLLSMDESAMPVQWWSDATRSMKKGYCLDAYLVWDKFVVLQSSHAKKEDKVLRAFADEEMVLNFDPDHLLLFPQRLIAYSFRARKFFVANIDFISIITAPKSPFRDLKIESEHKRILKSLVGRHFQKQDIRRRNKDAILDQDFIRGKGSGLVILLHGVPGVGKTTTAEAVAMDNRKPLFALTSGDLGSTSRDVETALRETFRLAAMWDCVLLLDEADLFLAKRDVGDLVRNSLVSVFLRVLDYYDGVLFLTTNRVGTVDEAFRSRIHLSLYYPALRKKQALEIFKLNIGRLVEIETTKAELRGKEEDGQSKLPAIEIDKDSILDFATRQWELTRNNPNRRWNGRQIRNSFQIAYSLVNLDQVSVPRSNYDDDYDDEDVDYGDEPDADVVHSKEPEISVTSPTVPVKAQKPGKLDSSQFEIVARSIQRFDSYLDRTRGPDSDYAKIKNLRRDDYLDSDDDDRSPRGHGRYADAAFPRSSPYRGADARSPASSGYLAPHYDRGGRAQRNIPREREQRSFGSRRAPVPDDDDDDYAEETVRPRAGAPHGSSPRSRPREYDDEYDHSYHRYR